MTRLTNVQSPIDILEQETVLWPDWVGMSPSYDEAVNVYMLRIWQYLTENEIETEQYTTPSEFDNDHSAVLQELADGLGISVNQFAMASGLAMTIHENGFSEWYALFDDDSLFEWEPSKEFEWTHRKHLVDHIHMAGPEKSCELFEDILDDRSQDEIRDDDELREMAKLLEELKSGAYP